MPAAQIWDDDYEGGSIQGQDYLPSGIPHRARPWTLIRRYLRKHRVSGVNDHCSHRSRADSCQNLTCELGLWAYPLRLAGRDVLLNLSMG